MRPIVPIKYHEKGRYQKLPIVRVLFAANLAFALVTLIAWQWALFYVLGPITWAADQTVPVERDFRHLLEYPLFMFWFGPAVAMAGGWALLQSQNYKAAFGVLALPVMMMLITLILYWIVPNTGL